MRSLAAAVAVVAALVTGCSTHDDRVDKLGERIVSELEKRPEVADASFVYKSGLDVGEHLNITAEVKDGESDAAQELIDLAVKETWLAPSNLQDMKIDITSAGKSVKNDKLPLPFSPAARESNKELYAELTAKYGPRPEK